MAQTQGKLIGTGVMGEQKPFCLLPPWMIRKKQYHGAKFNPHRALSSLIRSGEVGAVGELVERYCISKDERGASFDTDALLKRAQLIANHESNATF